MEHTTSTADAHEESAVATNYHPLPVTLTSGEGAWVTDDSGNRLLDLLSGYGAMNFGHRHPALVATAKAQLDRLTLTSRAFGSDQLEPFCQDLADLCHKDLVLPMNTGAEAVETSIKMARKWGYRVKGVPHDQAVVLVASGNFHGRTTTIISFSDDEEARDDYGPYTPGFRRVVYGDIESLRTALDEEGANVVAFLVEPIQGEGGVIIPPEGYLAEARRLCTEHDVLLMADEIQSGLGRVGTTFACELEGVVPDAYILGKALGGGIVPLSAVVADRDVLGVFTPGTHGSTFGGNPMACAVGREVVGMLRTGEFQQRAKELEPVLRGGLEAIGSAYISAVRVRGLWAGIDIIGRTGRSVSEGLLGRGVLCKDTHGSTVRFSPPLMISREDLEWGIGQIAEEITG
jgi:ornithine--oxo-acid transaminase